MLDDESPTSANLGSMNTLSIGLRHFGEALSIGLRGSGQYHTTVESRVRLTLTTLPNAPKFLKLFN